MKTELNNLTSEILMKNEFEKIFSILEKNKPKLIFDSKNNIFIGRHCPELIPCEINNLREELKIYFENFIPSLERHLKKSLRNRINDSELYDYVKLICKKTKS